MDIPKAFRYIWKRTLRRDAKKESMEMLFGSRDSVRKQRNKWPRFRYFRRKSNKNKHLEGFTGYDNPVQLGSDSCLPSSFSTGATVLAAQGTRSYENTMRANTLAVQLIDVQDTLALQNKQRHVKETQTSNLNEVLQQENKSFRESIASIENKCQELIQENARTSQMLTDVENKMTQLQNTMECRMDEMMSAYATLSGENNNLKQMIVDEEQLMNTRMTEATEDTERKLIAVNNDNANIQQRLMDMEAKRMEEEIERSMSMERLSTLESTTKSYKKEMKKVKKMKREANVMYIHEANTCQINTDTTGFMFTNDMDLSNINTGDNSSNNNNNSSSSSDSSDDDSSNSSSSNNNNGGNISNSEADSRDGNITSMQDGPSSEGTNTSDNFHHEFPESQGPSADQTYRKEAYVSEDAQHQPQETAPLEIPSVHLGEDTEAKQPVIRRKLHIGQIHEGLFALYNMLQNKSFNASSRLPDAYMNVIGHIIDLYGTGFHSFLDTINTPLHMIPEDVRQGGNRAVVAHAVYMWCCRQSGPAATGSSLAYEMSVIFSNFRPGTNYPIQVSEYFELGVDFL